MIEVSFLILTLLIGSIFVVKLKFRPNKIQIPITNSYVIRLLRFFAQIKRLLKAPLGLCLSFVGVRLEKVISL